MTERFGTDFAGRTVAGRYDVLELLGAGGMGAVYRAHDRELDEVVALKVIHTDLAGQPEAVERFRREVKLARRVTHANIARTFELGSADGVMFCTMELVDGESLRERLARDRKLAVAEAVAIAREVCHGLAAAHAAGIVHRDIKPDNVLLRGDGRIVLADFGIAALTAVAAGDASGTPAYMAPEQARGEPATAATDVYAVGVLLYEMLTGTRAFRGDLDSILEAKQQIEHLPAPQDAPPELARVIAHATERDPGARIASAEELARVLGAWARPSQVNVVVTRASRDAHQLHTIVVVAPRGDGERMHIAAGVHEALLQRLTERPRLRVLPRVEAGPPADGTTVVELVAHDDLAATVRGPGCDISLRLPLAVSDVSLAADAIAGAVLGGLERERDDATTREVRELVLRARHLAQHSLMNYPMAYELLERANRLAPGDPRIAAMLALACVRVAVFRPAEAGGFPRARELVRVALDAAPGLADSHVAAAHLELHTGEAAVAAIHFRRAIACSRYTAEGHEGLGRLLLEAGFLDVAMPRLEDALAIAPSLSTVRWDIARAWALEGRWDIVDPMVAAQVKLADRIVSRVRFACWRNDAETLDELRRSYIARGRRFDPILLESIYSVVLAGAWFENRDALVARATDAKLASKRSRALVAQLVAEAAGWVGDAATSLAMIAHAVDEGLFDLHWVDKCPVLEVTRREPGFFALRARIKQRADAIFDALYGDQDVAALSDTLAV